MSEIYATNSRNGIFSMIYTSYGGNVMKLLRTCNRHSLALTRFNAHLRFALQCKKRGVLPKSLRVKQLVKTEKGKNIALHAGRRFLLARISQCHRIINQNRIYVHNSCKDLSEKLIPSDFVAVLDFLQHSVNKLKVELQAKHQTKLNTLYTNSVVNNLIKHAPNNWIINLSKRQLTGDETTVLNLGLNFAISPKHVNKPAILASLEPAIVKLPLDKQSEFRSAVTKALLSAKPPAPNLTRNLQMALNNISRDSSIIITQADKGRCTVILDRKDYVGKANILLSNTESYKVVTKNPTTALQSKLNTTISSLEKKAKIDKNIGKALRCYTGKLPQFFAYPKLHKEGIPLRPIVDCTNSPIFPLSKFMAKLMKPLIGQTECNVNSSFELIELLNNFNVPEDCVMASLDVVSLFTSIPTKLALDVVESKLKEGNALFEVNNLHNTKFSIDDIISLLKLCLDATVFEFEGKIYIQIHGTAMGSPSSSSVADSVMEWVEQKIINHPESGILLWKRYVDDIFIVIKENSLQNVLKIANDVCKNIQFTIEHEHNNSLPFLDILIKRNDNKLHTSVYRKDTSTGKFLHFSSQHPSTHKRAVVQTLTHRMNTYCKDETSQKQEWHNIKDQLANNGYPNGFITRNKAVPTLHSANRNELPKNQEHRGPRAVIPYTKGISERIAKLCRSFNMEICYKPQNTLKQRLCNFKQPIDPQEKINAIYRIFCDNCNSAYTGQTKRNVSTRIREHKRSLHFCDYNSKLVTHMMENNHQPNWDNISVLQSNVANYHSRLFMETWYSLTTDKRPINEFAPLPAEYVILRQPRQTIVEQSTSDGPPYRAEEGF